LTDRNIGPAVMPAAASQAGALLVGLAVPDDDLEAVFALLEVLDIERHELGATEGARKAHQQHGAVPQAFHVRAGGDRHGNDAFGRGRGFLPGRGPDGAADAAHRGLDPLIIRGDGMAGELMGVANRGDTAAER
jgi:hypothetical protein